AKIGLPIFCHATQADWLRQQSEMFVELERKGQVRFYDIGVPWEPTPTLRCLPLEVAHDGGVTCGFRFEATAPAGTRGPALAYLADLGIWNQMLARQLADVDLLAVEFNHDVGLQRSSGRHPRLIARILGREGHLSNE